MNSYFNDFTIILFGCTLSRLEYHLQLNWRHSYFRDTFSLCMHEAATDIAFSEQNE